MPKLSNLTVLRALGHESRLRLVDALLAGPLSVEDLAERLDLAPSTVSHHLKKLQGAGLAQRKRDQYYAIYSLTDGWLDWTVRQLVSTAQLDRDAQADRQEAKDRKVVDRFFENGRLTKIPRQKKKRDLVLDVFAAKFEPGREYAEMEVNELIRAHFEDHCQIRRQLVDRGTLLREKGRYRLHQTTETEDEMSRRKELIDRYKRQPRVGGVYRVTHTPSGRSLWGTSVNAQSRLNRHQVQLRIGSHPEAAMQADWAADGLDAFAFEIVESVEEQFEPGFSLVDEVESLALLWAERVDAPMDVYQ